MLQHEIVLDRFSASFPKGHPVWHWLQLPFGPVLECTIWSDPFVDRHGDLVVQVTKRNTPVSIHTVTEIDEARRPHLTVLQHDRDADAV